jgi:hypothetical protein
MNQVKDNLNATNAFKPNLSSLNPEERSLFDSIKLSGYLSYMNLFKSQILTGEQQSIDLINLCEFSPRDKWSLLYRGTRDGFGAKDFHAKCVDHANTLTILKAKESSFIFGGFTTVSWESCPEPGKYKSDPNAFLFSLTNKDNIPVKMTAGQNLGQHLAIFCHCGFGPSFGVDIILKAISIQQWIVILIWVFPIHILNMKRIQMKLKHFWLDRIVFNWTKLKSIKKNEKK